MAKLDYFNNWNLVFISPWALSVSGNVDVFRNMLISSIIVAVMNVWDVSVTRKVATA